MAGRIRVGTASWTDPSLIKSGRFYPKGCNSPAERLKFYASQFPIVEVDSSYYAMPSSTNAQKWVERTPDDFVFNIKAFRLFTGHHTDRRALPRDVGDALASHFETKKNIYYKDTPAEIRDVLWERYNNGIRPLREAGKLRSVLFQYAPWVKCNAKSLEHIDECRARLPDDLLAIEFRDRGWFDERNRQRVLDFERERGLVNVVVDEPQGTRNSIPTVWEVTSPKLAILRMHGRNTKTWNIKGESAADRFNYDYPDDELKDLMPAIDRLADQALEVDVIFNNNYEDQGQRNARTLMGYLPPGRKR